MSVLYCHLVLRTHRENSREPEIRKGIDDIMERYYDDTSFGNS